MTDHGPVGAVNRSPIADLETGELASAGVARDEFMEPRLKHAAAREAHLGSVLGHGRHGSDQRKIDSIAHHATAPFNGDLGLGDDDGLAPSTLEDARQLENGGGFLPGDVALPRPRTRRDQDDTVGANIAHLLSTRTGAHGEHGDEYSHGAGDPDDDGQYGCHALSDSREVHEQHGETLSGDGHIAVSALSVRWRFSAWRPQEPGPPR